MGTLTITTDYVDDSILTQAHLDTMASSIETFINATNINYENMTDAGVTKAKLALAVQYGLCPTGTILPYAGATGPAGWLLCHGASVLITTYQDLYDVIDDSYGAVDGTHFNVPDLRGMFLRGQDGGVATDPDAAARTAMNTGGNTGDNMGSVQATATKSPITAFTTSNANTVHTHTWASTETDFSRASHAHSVVYGTNTASCFGMLASNGNNVDWYSIAVAEWTPTSTIAGTTGSSSAANTAALRLFGNTGTTSGEQVTGTMTNNNTTHYHVGHGSGGDNESRPPNATVNYIIKT